MLRSLTARRAVALSVVATSALLLMQSLSFKPHYVTKNDLQAFRCRTSASSVAKHFDIEFRSNGTEAIVISDGKARTLSFVYHFMFADRYVGDEATLRIDPEVYLAVDGQGYSRPCDAEPVFDADAAG